MAVLRLVPRDQPAAAPGKTAADHLAWRTLAETAADLQTMPVSDETRAALARIEAAAQRTAGLPRRRRIDATPPDCA